ncbi:hypothetical protein PIB30_008837 [Stylosanthes scabra]|uniref:DEAD-box ATP-dependent RNA helicase 33 n=1 Tax=Stylosanthes scabra TaxID=79078 RepID=A0ABU6Y6P5_9FABA|nr:hypothetical protein [Stylosanthes scabra]
MNPVIPNLPQHLSFSKSVSLSLSVTATPTPHLPVRPRFPAIIRMGGGPRTYPGGVSKWQWKRMQANKAKQLLKARLCRERQVYEMRKRAELRAAVSDLERPWEPVQQAPSLFSVRADEQVKVLADRFQRPGGFDLWSEKDGPQLFQTPDELPSARFFPKGVVHSVRPYRRIDADELLGEGRGDGDHGDGEDSSDSRFLSEGLDDESDDQEGYSAMLSSSGNNGMSVDGGLKKNGRNGQRLLSEHVSNEGFPSSPLDYGRKGVNSGSRMRKNRNGSRFMSEGGRDGSDNEVCSSPSSYGRNGGNCDGRMRRNTNGRRPFIKDDDYGSDDGEYSFSPFSSERNGRNADGRVRKNGNGRRFPSRDVNGSNDGEYPYSPFSSERNGGNVDGRMRKNGNGRRFTSKDVNGSYYGRVGSGMRQGRSNPSANRRDGKYSSRKSSYDMSRVRDANAEVYEMDLQRDGSYGFHRKSEQSESRNW